MNPSYFSGAVEALARDMKSSMEAARVAYVRAEALEARSRQVDDLLSQYVRAYVLLRKSTFQLPPGELRDAINNFLEGE